MYRIYTQDKNRRFICRTIAEHFPGFSVIKQTRFWQGRKEKSLCIEIVSDASVRARHYIDLICRAIKGYNRQAAVMVYIVEGEMLLI